MLVVFAKTIRADNPFTFLLLQIVPIHVDMKMIKKETHHIYIFLDDGARIARHHLSFINKYTWAFPLMKVKSYL